MTATELEQLVTSHGLKIDKHPSKGYGDVEIGTGADYNTLRKLVAAIKTAAPWATPITRTVSNPEHPQAGQLYVEFPSFWWEQPATQSETVNATPAEPTPDLRAALAQLFAWAEEANRRLDYEPASMDQNGFQFGGNPHANPLFKRVRALLGID